jgi:glycosyltransferase 2 family protein
MPFRLIGLVLLFIVLYRLDWTSLLKLTNQLNTVHLLLALPLFTATIILKSIRWNFLLKIQEISIPAFVAFRFYAASIFWGIITPGRIGEAAKIVYLNKRGVSAGRAGLSVALDRLLDISSLLILAVIGSAIVFHKLVWFFIGFTITILSSLFLYQVRSKLNFPAVIRVLFRFLPERFQETFSRFEIQFKSDFRKFSCLRLITLSFFSVLIWLIYTIPFFLLGSSIRIEVSSLFVLTGIFVSVIVAMLPISIGGVGTREAFFIFYFNLFGISKEKSLLFSFMFIYMHIFSVIFGVMMSQLGNEKL